MPKEVKGNPRRKPPEPAAGHECINEWFGLLMPRLVPIVRELDEAIQACIPGLAYAVKFKRAFYGLAGLGWIIEVAPYDVSVNVVFLGGALFDPPPPLGNVDQSRYVKITTLADVQRSDLRDWIEQASRTPGWT